MGASRGGSTNAGLPITTSSPGVFGSGPSGIDAFFNKGDYSQSSQFAGQAANIFNQPFNFAPKSQSQTDLLNSIMDLTEGRSAVRGLGPATQGALATDIAPTLTNFATTERGLDLSSAQGLMELAGLSMPQTITGGGGTYQSSWK